MDGLPLLPWKAYPQHSGGTERAGDLDLARSCAWPRTRATSSSTTSTASSPPRRAFANSDVRVGGDPQHRSQRQAQRQPDLRYRARAAAPAGGQYASNSPQPLGTFDVVHTYLKQWKSQVYDFYDPTHYYHPELPQFSDIQVQQIRRRVRASLPALSAVRSASRRRSKKDLARRHRRVLPAQRARHRRATRDLQPLRIQAQHLALLGRRQADLQRRLRSAGHQRHHGRAESRAAAPQGHSRSVARVRHLPAAGAADPQRRRPQSPIGRPRAGCTSSAASPTTARRTDRTRSWRATTTAAFVSKDRTGPTSGSREPTGTNNTVYGATDGRGNRVFSEPATRPSASSDDAHSSAPHPQLGHVPRHAADVASASARTCSTSCSRSRGTRR